MIVAMLMTVAWASEPQDECFPPCRTGYLCHKGACLSRCNPKCDAGEHCTNDGECEANDVPEEARQPKGPDAPAGPTGEVCVFRSRFFVGSAVQFSISDGDERMTTLNVGQYHCWSTQAGTRRITLTSAAAGYVSNGFGTLQGANSTTYEIVVPAGDVVYHQMRLHKLIESNAERFAKASAPYKAALHTKESLSSLEWVQRHQSASQQTHDLALAKDHESPPDEPGDLTPETPQTPQTVAVVAPTQGQVCAVRAPDDAKADLPITWIEGAVLLGTQARDKPLCWSAAPGLHNYVASASGSAPLQIEVKAGSTVTIVTHTEAFEGMVRPVLSAQTTAAP